MARDPDRFELHPRLAADTYPVKTLGLCELRLMDDRRWPWLILVPQRPNVTEFFELRDLDQTMLSFEAGLVARPFKLLTGCDKLNSGLLGNMVPQLHMHLVARSEGDPNWPGPVWGYGTAERYDPDVAEAFIGDIVKAILPV